MIYLSGISALIIQEKVISDQPMDFSQGPDEVFLYQKSPGRSTRDPER